MSRTTTILFPATSLINMILSETCLTSKNTSTHFSANENVNTTHALVVSYLKHLISEIFSFEKPSRYTSPSYKLQMSTLHLNITASTSFDWPFILQIFHENNLKFWCDNWQTIWWCSHHDERQPYCWGHFQPDGFQPPFHTGLHWKLSYHTL